jgi:hypothetical protein
MRLAVFACTAIVALSACESDLEVHPATIQWLEWPAEVLVGTPFKARSFLLPPVCFEHRFKPGLTLDQSAVTIAPYYLVKPGQPICPPTASASDLLPNPGLDTVLTLPALTVPNSRTFEMRASANADAPNPQPGVGNLPIRTFGDVTVRMSNPDASRTNVAGRVIVQIDNQGCARIQPGGFFSPGVEYVLEDQADTAGVSFAFVRGYLHDVTTPVCGQTRVFHLVTVN